MRKERERKRNGGGEGEMKTLREEKERNSIV